MQKYIILRSASKKPVVRDLGRPQGRAFAGAPAPEVTVERLPAKAVGELNLDPQVAAVCPAMPTSLIRPLASASSQAVENWGIAAVGADGSGCTGRGVTVAVLDTGIDREHPAFAGVQLVERDFSGDGDGDRQGHGTHCAGTIFGRDVGVRVGVARGVTRALIGKVLGDSGSGASEMIFQALQWVVAERADVISMSLGFDFPGMVADLTGAGWPADLATSTALEAYRGNLRMFDAIMGVLKAQAAFGTSPLVVAASGNESRREVNADYRIAASLPAAANDVLSVAAVGREGASYKIADFSNTLPTVAAPGVDICSAWPGGGLNTISGTSMACPHVAGIAALWWEALRRSPVRPSVANVRARLLASARTDVFAGGYDEADVGQGMVTAPQGAAQA